MFKHGPRALLLKHVPAAWAIAQKLLAAPAAQSSVLARFVIWVVMLRVAANGATNQARVWLTWLYAHVVSMPSRMLANNASQA